MPDRNERTLERLESLAETVLPKTRSFIEAGEEALPTAFILDRSVPGGLEIIGLVFRDPAEKRMAARMLRQRGSRMGVEGVLLIVESWWKNVSVEAVGDLVNAAIHGIRNDPERLEALVVMLLTPSTQRMVIYPFERVDGRIEWKEPLREDWSDPECAWDPWNYRRTREAVPVE